MQLISWFFQSTEMIKFIKKIYPISTSVNYVIDKNYSILKYNWLLFINKDNSRVFCMGLLCLFSHFGESWTSFESSSTTGYKLDWKWVRIVFKVGTNKQLHSGDSSALWHKKIIIFVPIKYDCVWLIEQSSAFQASSLSPTVSPPSGILNHNINRVVFRQLWATIPPI